jgi:hypothetical protein
MVPSAGLQKIGCEERAIFGLKTSFGGEKGFFIHCAIVEVVMRIRNENMELKFTLKIRNGNSEFAIYDAKKIWNESAEKGRLHTVPSPGRPLAVAVTEDVHRIRTIESGSDRKVLEWSRDDVEGHANREAGLFRKTRWI